MTTLESKLRALVVKWRTEKMQTAYVIELTNELESLLAERQEPLTFQQRVRQWTLACFGQAIADDKVERNHRFLEESLELVQVLGCTQSEAHQLVDYVYNRPQGHAAQECGGVLVTLMALCNANGLNAEPCGEDELARVYQKIEQIRAKQAAKPKHSPLSIAAEPSSGTGESK